MANLIDKLRPAKARGVGKLAECPKCGGLGEHVTARYIACDRCDSDPPEDQLRQYVCLTCGHKPFYRPSVVAAGKRCHACYGVLLMVPA
jgi:hypothetical protein